jgi:hypothetical protein
MGLTMNRKQAVAQQMSKKPNKVTKNERVRYSIH